MGELAVDSCIRGHHISMASRSPTIDEEWLCKREGQNPDDSYAVAIAIAIINV